MATIKDIAEATEVSQSTVSRVLNYDQDISVSPETRKRIFETAESLNYTKHKAKKKQKILSALLVRWYDDSQELEHLYYLNIRVGIEAQCKERNIKLDKINIMDSVPKKKYDGILILGKYSKIILEKFENQSIPIICVGFDGSTFNHHSVLIDFESGVQKSLEKFINLGHTEIGILSGKDYNKYDKEEIQDERLLSFERYLTSKNLLNEHYIYEADFSTRGGYNTISEHLNSKKPFPTALFVSNDPMAIGAIHALNEHEYKIPEEIEIISFNDVSIAKYFFPTLSSVNVNSKWMGEVSVDLLESYSKTPPSLPTKLIIQPELVTRSSTTKVK